MRWPVIEPPAGDVPPVWKRLGWLVAIWALSVAALGLVAYAIRLWIAP
jgi:hypothetical protein